MSQSENKEIQTQQNLKDLPVQLGNLIEKTSPYTKIATRSADPNESFGELKTFTEENLNELAENMDIHNEKMNNFGRTNSFHTNKLMTLQMLSKGSPYRILRQTLSQIERKRQAVKDSFKGLKQKKLDSEKLVADIEDLEGEINDKQSELNQLMEDSQGNYIDTSDNPPIRKQIRDSKREIRQLQYDLDNKKIELEELQSSTADMRVYLESAFKEIGSFQEAYEQVRKNWNIPEDWDEGDYEEYEPRFHVRHIFQHAMRDLVCHGKIGMGTSEHCIQMGINLVQLESEVQQFISNMKGKIYSKGEDGEGNSVIRVTGDATYDEMEEWLKEMEEKYKDNYTDAMKSLGLDYIYNDKYLYHSEKKQIEE